jgi:(E)-4-hydroxy-3-methylbut-2-enyl-diphosphate synthase
MKISRRKTKTVKVGNIAIGGNNPIAIQSMVKTKTSKIQETLRQIQELDNVGCEIVRLAVEDSLDAKAIKKIKQKINIPLVADIHFDWRLALEAIDNGVDKIRLNPGNIYKKDQIREIVRAAKLARIPIRVGVNSGSLFTREKSISNLSQMRTSEVMVKNALDYVRILEGFKFYDIVLSLKSANIFDTLESYRSVSRHLDYPLHLGVTATGTWYTGAIKSSIVISALLLEGIGDTIRISLTADSQEEVKVAKVILETLDLRCFGPEIYSCPTCGRCKVDLIKIVNRLEDSLYWSTRQRDNETTRQRIRIAIMGCVVNGPGEAKEADIGVAFGKRDGLLFKDGRPLKKISSAEIVNVLLKEIRRTRCQR